MTARATIKFTRPDLDHQFLLENMDKILLSFQHNFLGDYVYKQMDNKMPDGFVENSLDEFISWRDIISRKNELRSDLQTWLEQNEFSIQSNSQFENDDHYGPGINPFSLTFTHHSTFDTIENATVFLRLFRLSEEGINAISTTNNTVEFYIDGNLVDINTL